MRYVIRCYNDCGRRLYVIGSENLYGWTEEIHKATLFHPLDIRRFKIYLKIKKEMPFSFKNISFGKVECLKTNVSSKGSAIKERINKAEK